MPRSLSTLAVLMLLAVASPAAGQDLKPPGAGGDLEPPGAPSMPAATTGTQITDACPGRSMPVPAYPASTSAVAFPCLPQGSVGDEGAAGSGLGSPDEPEDGSGEWTLVDSPNTRSRQTIHYLYGTTCVSADDCWAVGYSSRIGSYRQTLVMRWDGEAWRIVPSPSSTVVKHNVLRDVACVSASDCWAVGHQVVGSHYQTLTIHWDGTAWTIVDSPNRNLKPQIEVRNHNQLLSVSCAAASDCWAVGYSDPPGDGYRTLVLRWDGATWTLVDSPNSTAYVNSSLTSVDCTGPADCWATGATWGNTYHTLTAHWDGSSWALVTSPDVSIEQHNALLSVACMSASDCWAVGWTGLQIGTEQPLIEHWDGTAWSITSSPSTDPAKQNVLTSVDCVPAACLATGFHWTGTVANTLAVALESSEWTLVESENAIPTEHNAFYGVACASASACVAVGHYVSGGFDHALAERWDGVSWATEPTPNDASAENDNILFGMTCLSETNCWAVGTTSNHVYQQTLIEHWDGSSWTVVPSPNSSANQHNTLLDVTCVAASDCWAVGGRHDGEAYRTLTLHWDGTAWSIVPSPNELTPGAKEVGDALTGVIELRPEDNGFYSVTCVSSTDCWAVGFHVPLFRPGGALIEHWDGTAWELVPSPGRVTPSASPGSQRNTLTGVSCASASDCWAVGYHYTGTNYETLVQRWDGTLWTAVTSPNVVGSHSSFLEGVTCVSATNCWAAGPSWTGTVFETLIQRWDGSSWTIVPSPNQFDATSSFLDNVTCASASRCWAVGHHVMGGVAQTLIIRWDGTGWAIEPSPSTSPTRTNWLTDISCIASTCMSSGSAAPDAYRTLTLERRPS